MVRDAVRADQPPIEIPVTEVYLDLVGEPFSEWDESRALAPLLKARPPIRVRRRREVFSFRCEGLKR